MCVHICKRMYIYVRFQRWQRFCSCFSSSSHCSIPKSESSFLTTSNNMHLLWRRGQRLGNMIDRQNKGVQRLEPFVPNADAKPPKKRTKSSAKNQMADNKKNNWQRRGNRLSRTKQNGIESLKKGTKRRAVSNRKALKKQRTGRSRIYGNKRSKRCEGKRMKSKVCRGRPSTRRGRQIKYQRNTRRRSLRKKTEYSMQEKRQKEKEKLLLEKKRRHARRQDTS